MFKGFSNFTSLLRSAQQMTGRMQQVNESLKQQRATGAAGGGMVEVDVNGLGEVLGVRIEPDLVARGEREMIEDLLPAAINQAQTKAKQLHVEAMQSVAGDLNVPGLDEALQQFTGNPPDDSADKT